MLKDIKIDLLYQNTIAAPPASAGNIYEHACKGDRVTVNTWKETWKKHYISAKERFGTFEDLSIGKLYGINRHKPAIILGSGPSLNDSIEALKKNQAQEHPVLTISTLHNLGHLDDNGIKADYYVSLDSGSVVIEDATEKMNKDGDFYWDQTKDKTLLAYVSSDPKLFDLWQGKIHLFNCLLPDLAVRKELNDIERFTSYVSSGGNAGGACMYIAKAIFGSATIIYCGIDMCFNYDNTFHFAKSKYDTLGNYVLWPDVYGVPRKTWQSYLNFKFFLDHIAMTIPGNWVSSSNGLLGAYREGNLACFEYKPLEFVLQRYQMADNVTLQRNKAGTNEVVEANKINLAEVFGTTKYEHDIVLF